MLRTLANIVVRRQPIRRLYGAFVQKILCPKSPVLSKFRVVQVQHFGTRAKFIEEETISYKIREYLRADAGYAVLSSSREKHTAFDDVMDEMMALNQKLLVISQSPKVVASDIIEVCSSYFSCLSLMQRSFPKTDLVKTFLSRVKKSLSHMTPRELQQLALLVREHGNQKFEYFQDISCSIATHCENRVSETSISQCLELFDVLLILFGNYVTQRSEFNTFMLHFESHLQSAKPHELVKILHHIGLAKKKSLSQEFAARVVENLELHLHTLTFCNAGIAASGLFKAGIRLDSSSLFLLEANKLLQKKASETHHLTELEIFAFISLMKLLRKANYRCDSNFVSHLSEFVLKAEWSHFSPQVCPHFLTFYSNMNLYDEEVFCKLETAFLEYLRKEHLEVRWKDVSQVVWAFSNTGHAISPEFLVEIEKYLMHFAHGPKSSKHLLFLSDTLCNLACSGLYFENIIKKISTSQMIQELSDYQRSKKLSRFLTLSECIRIEAPNIEFELPPVSPNALPKRTFSDEILNRPSLCKLMEGVHFINNALGVKVLKLKFIIRTLNYANVVLDFKELENVERTSLNDEQFHIIKQLSLSKEKCQNKLLAIEVIESKSLIMPVSRPIGFIRLKNRLIQQSGWIVKVILQSEIEQCGDDKRAVAALIIDSILKCN